MTPDVVRRELAKMGEAFASPRWAQGPGGNVSVKHDGMLFVKASGTRLETVATDAGHARVAMADAKAALGGDAEAERRVFGVTPRPSLETFFHALGGAVVAHTHAVGVLLAACSGHPIPVDARVPYTRPGRGLADAVAARGGAQTVLLESHGLLVYADTADEAIATTRRIDEACLEAFGVGFESFDRLVASYMRAPIVSLEGGFARPLPARRGAFDCLFPDAAVYASRVPVDAADERAAARALLVLGRAAVIVDDAGARMAIAKSVAALGATVEILAAHDWVEDVLHARGVARYLAEDEPAQIVGLPSEQYRMRL